MKGVILAGGNGTRLKPLTDVTNKHLLPIYNKPMVFYPIDTLKSMGINDIILVTGKEFSGDFADLLGNGKKFGIEFTYKVQEEALGIAHALGTVKNTIGKDPITVILGDNIFMLGKAEIEELKKRISEFSKNPSGAMIFLKEVNDPERFGVPEFDGNNNVIKIEEKPKEPKSKYAVTGLYIYDNTLFDKISKLKPSKRGEFELTDVNNLYIGEGRLKSHIIKGEWTDAGTFESLYRAGTLAKHLEEKNM
jgi:glucose-1-phosphate thymidylyltransferase